MGAMGSVGPAGSAGPAGTAGGVGPEGPPGDAGPPGTAEGWALSDGGVGDGGPVLYTTNNGNVGIGTQTPQALLHVQGGGIYIDQDAFLLPRASCRPMTLSSPAADLGSQLATLLTTYRCVNVTLAANTTWTWNTPIQVADFQTLTVTGAGYANGATNITVTIDMTQNQTFTNGGTAYREPNRVTVGSNGLFGLYGVDVHESSNDARPLSPGSCEGGALFTPAVDASSATVDVTNTNVTTSEDFIGIGSRAFANVHFGWTTVNQAMGAPRAISAVKSYTGWCFDGGYAIVHDSVTHTTLGTNVSMQTSPKLVYSN
jgi:hypothetical protein